VRVRNQKIDMSNPTGLDSTTRYTAFLALHLPSHSLHSIPTMSVAGSKEWVEAFLESEPDSMFPCSHAAWLRKVLRLQYDRFVENLAGYAVAKSAAEIPGLWLEWTNAGNRRATDEQCASVVRDTLGRCQLKCANCNCRMLFNELKCVKADLETTKETLKVTANDLDETKVALEECKKERTDEKRRFSIAIAKMVQSEMSDVRTQLSALNLCLKEELGEKALEKKAASEAAKAALSASKFITLRLLMF